jgi:hypothetical protein
MAFRHALLAKFWPSVDGGRERRGLVPHPHVISEQFLPPRHRTLARAYGLTPADRLANAFAQSFVGATLANSRQFRLTQISASSASLHSHPRYWPAQRGQTSTSHPSRWSSPAETQQSWHGSLMTSTHFTRTSLLISCFQKGLRCQCLISCPNQQADAKNI